MASGVMKRQPGEGTVWGRKRNSRVVQMTLELEESNGTLAFGGLVMGTTAGGNS